VSDLRRFVLVQRFARHKLKSAVVDFAERRLSSEVMAIASSGESYDTAALFYAIYYQNWGDLALLYQLEKIHRKGFARMRLRERLRSPEISVRQFLAGRTLEGILAEYDKKVADGRLSQFKSHMPHDGTDLVFIRRSDKPGMLLRGSEIMHGFAPEWIILDFRQSASGVNICSESIRPSLEIANAIASAYYGTSCEYENDRIAIYPQQLRHFINQLLAEQAHELALVEVRVCNSPLKTGPKLVISADDGLSIAPALQEFGEAFSSLLEHLEDVSAIKVLFRGKRVSLIFDDGSEDDDPLPLMGTDPTDRPFVVRYTDHVLTVAERQAFEQLMEEVHGIAVVSTEKRFRS
jgi:hypothetical protein